MLYDVIYTDGARDVSCNEHLPDHYEATDIIPRGEDDDQECQGCLAKLFSEI